MYENQTLEELKDVAWRRGIVMGGTKAELIKRLRRGSNKTGSGNRSYQKSKSKIKSNSHRDCSSACSSDSDGDYYDMLSAGVWRISGCDDTSGHKTNGGWLKHWMDCTDYRGTAMPMCRFANCGEEADRGAHVNVKGQRDQWIIPACAHHNSVVYSERHGQLHNTKNTKLASAH